MDIKFETNTFNKRLKSMLNVDFKRMFISPLFYILVGVCLVIPILILVMTSMMDGTTSIDPQTGKETVMEGFDNVWQMIGSTTKESQSQGMNMSLTGMCNINMLYFAIIVFVSLFIGQEFKCGYSKNSKERQVFVFPTSSPEDCPQLSHNMCSAPALEN